MKRTAFIAIVGRPNVGKSTLLNAILGEKVAIVSSKPQTTRNRITGIYTKDEDQFVFLDTPGMHSPKNSLGEYMVKAADSTMRDADAVVLVVGVHHLAAIVGGCVVSKEVGEQLAECVGLLAEDVERVEAVAGHIEIDPIAEDRCSQWLAIACHNRATTRVDRVGHKDSLLQTVGIVSHLATKPQYPHQAHDHA